MKTILLLGGYGFIGTNILKFIDKNVRGYHVVVFDRYPEHCDHIEFDCVIKSYAGDFSDTFMLERVFFENKIDIVIHSLSASVPSMSNDNAFDLQYNVLPTIKLLDVMTKHGVNKMIFISSGGAIYGDHYINKTGHVEDEPLFPKSAYGVSKLVIEKFLYLYYVQNGLNSLVLRLSNPYGPYHYSQKQGIINIALEAALQGREFQIWGDGIGKKDYIYIDDFCQILIQLIKKDWDNYIVLNVGSGELISVNGIVDRIKAIIPDFKWCYKEFNALDVNDVKLNLSQLNRMVHFSSTTLQDGLRRTMNWYQSRKIK